MFIQRAIVSAIFGALAFWLLYLGGWWYFVPVLTLMLIGGFEYTKMMQEMAYMVNLPLMLAAIGLQIMAAILFGSEGLSAALIVSLFASLCWVLWRFESGANVGRLVSAEWFATVTGIIFLGWMGSHFILIRNIDPATGSAAWQWTTIVIMATWVADMGAYMVGSFITKFIGRHALTPRLSPKKSVEGYIGGILSGMLFGWVVGGIVFGLPLGIVLILSLFVAALGTAGDLCVSMLKREAKVKDSGVLFPGHGGSLDRTDSIIWTTAISYYLLQLFL